MGLYIIIMGVQGAGKGVQSRFIQKQYGIPQVSTGDLFRAMETREDHLARRVQEIMKAGHLVPDEVTNEMVRDRLEQPDAANGAIFDGFPRNRAQAEWLESYLAGKGSAVATVLLLTLDLYVAFKRAFGRVMAESGESYNIYYNADDLEWEFVDHPDGEFPPRLVARKKSTGEQFIRRPDDANAGAIIQRMDLYQESTQPLIDYFRDKGLVTEIDADQGIEAVRRDIEMAIERARTTSG